MAARPDSGRNVALSGVTPLTLSTFSATMRVPLVTGPTAMRLPLSCVRSVGFSPARWKMKN